MEQHIAYATRMLRAANDCKLVATVNHRDNFHLWAAQSVFHSMIDSMDSTGTLDVVNYNALCDESRAKLPRGETEIWASKSPTIRAICDRVYDEMNKA